MPAGCVISVKRIVVCACASSATGSNPKILTAKAAKDAKKSLLAITPCSLSCPGLGSKASSCNAPANLPDRYSTLAAIRPPHHHIYAARKKPFRDHYAPPGPADIASGPYAGEQLLHRICLRHVALEKKNSWRVQDRA